MQEQCPLTVQEQLQVVQTSSYLFIYLMVKAFSMFILIAVEKQPRA